MNLARSRLTCVGLVDGSLELPSILEDLLNAKLQERFFDLGVPSDDVTHCKTALALDKDVLGVVPHAEQERGSSVTGEDVSNVLCVLILMMCSDVSKYLSGALPVPSLLPVVGVVVHVNFLPTNMYPKIKRAESVFFFLSFFWFKH